MTGIIGVTVHARVSKWSERRRVDGLVLSRGEGSEGNGFFAGDTLLSRGSKVGPIIPLPVRSSYSLLSRDNNAPRLFTLV